MPINLAEQPQQPDNIQNRMLNQIFIANKQHMDLKPCQVSELEMDMDQIDADKLLKEKLFQDKIRK